jgi:phosphoribosylaminoimidazole-succinocarboxamide synthase
MNLDQLTSEERLQRLFRDYNAILADNTQRLAQIVDDLKLEFTLLSNETKVLRDQVKTIRPTE